MELGKVSVDGPVAAENESGIVVLGRLNSERQLDIFAKAKLLNCLFPG
jgi:hypothetical protein